MADPELYRLKDEIEQYRKRDAIEALKQHMMERGMLDEGGWQDVVSRVDHAVDEAVAFTGGVGIADVWTGDARNEEEWRDPAYGTRVTDYYLGALGAY